MSFKELGVIEELTAVLAAQGIEEPTAAQVAALPAIIAGKSILCEAPTGTGKTLAYLLPALQAIDPAVPRAQVVIIAPTYELAMQITNVARVLNANANLGLKIQGLIGGANIARQIDNLKEKPQLVIGSAGRIIELAAKGKLRLAQVKLLVLDEFDRLLDDQNIEHTVELIKHRLPQDIQYVMASATAPRKALERASFLNVEHIRVAESADDAARRENMYLIVPFREKIETIRRLSRSLAVHRGLVFINRAYDAEKTLAHLKYDGVKAATLLGKGGKQERQSAIAGIKSGKYQLLLATDVAARGLDIEDVDYVFNLDIPESAEVYRHRAGRTARAGKTGTVVTLADMKEAVKLAALEKKLGIELKSLKKGAPRLETAVKEARSAKGKIAPKAKSDHGRGDKPKDKFSKGSGKKPKQGAGKKPSAGGKKQTKR